MEHYTEADTRYVKPARKVTPSKADHAHEYIRAVTYMHMRRFDGSVSAEKHRYTLRDECVICGHRYVGRNPKAVEVEITPAEYRARENNR